MPRGARDHRGEAPRRGDFAMAARECDRFEMAFHNLAAIDERQPPLLVDDRVHRQRAADHPDDLQLVGVEWVAVEHAVVGVRVVHVAGAVEGGDGVRVRQTRSDDPCAHRTSRP